MAKQTVTDQIVMSAIARIVSVGYPTDVKCEMLDVLRFTVENLHPHGMAAQVLDKVSEAQDAVLFPKGGDA